MGRKRSEASHTSSVFRTRWKRPCRRPAQDSRRAKFTKYAQGFYNENFKYKTVENTQNEPFVLGKRFLLTENKKNQNRRKLNKEAKRCFATHDEDIDYFNMRIYIILIACVYIQQFNFVQ